MTREKALLLPDPHGVAVGVPTEVEVGADGTAPERIEYDGNPYRVVDGRGPAGERLYELFE